MLSNWLRSVGTEHRDNFELQNCYVYSHRTFWVRDATWTKLVCVPPYSQTKACVHEIRCIIYTLIDRFFHFLFFLTASGSFHWADSRPTSTHRVHGVVRKCDLHWYRHKTSTPIKQLIEVLKPKFSSTLRPSI